MTTARSGLISRDHARSSPITGSQYHQSDHGFAFCILLDSEKNLPHCHTILPPPAVLPNVRQFHFECVISRGVSCYNLSLRVFHSEGYPMVRLFPSCLRHIHPGLQLDAIPTVWFSDPILSYLSALIYL